MRGEGEEDEEEEEEGREKLENDKAREERERNKKIPASHGRRRLFAFKPATPPSAAVICIPRLREPCLISQESHIDRVRQLSPDGEKRNLAFTLSRPPIPPLSTHIHNQREKLLASVAAPGGGGGAYLAGICAFVCAS